MSATDLRARELECEGTILQAAEMAGWRRHGERAAVSRKKWSTPIKGDAGWPDLVLANGTQVIAAELKRYPNEPTDDQLTWLRMLDNRPHVVALVLWVPEQMDTFNTQLFTRHTFEWPALFETVAHL